MNKRNVAALLLIAGVMAFISLPILAVNKLKEEEPLSDGDRIKLPPKAFTVPASCAWIH